MNEIVCRMVTGMRGKAVTKSITTIFTIVAPQVTSKRVYLQNRHSYVWFAIVAICFIQIDMLIFFPAQRAYWKRWFLLNGAMQKIWSISSTHFTKLSAIYLKNYQNEGKKIPNWPRHISIKTGFSALFLFEQKRIQLWFIAWIAIFKLTNECDSIEKWYKQYVSKQITIQLNDFLIHYCQNEIAIATCWTSRTFNEYNILRDGVKKFAQKAI